MPHPDETDPDLARLRVDQGGTWRVARVVTTVLDPLVVLLVLLVAVGLSSGGATGLGWALLVAALLLGVPSAVVWIMVRTGRATGHRLVLRRERLVPSLVALASCGSALGLLRWFGAPADLTALVTTLLAGVVIGALVNLWTKVSVHSSTMALAAVVTWTRFGEVTGTVVAIGALLCAWSRHRLGRHSLPQIVLGLTLGAGVALGVELLRP